MQPSRHQCQMTWKRYLGGDVAEGIFLDVLLCNENLETRLEPRLLQSDSYALSTLLECTASYLLHQGFHNVQKVPETRVTELRSCGSSEFWNLETKSISSAKKVWERKVGEVGLLDFLFHGELHIDSSPIGASLRLLSTMELDQSQYHQAWCLSFNRFNFTPSDCALPLCAFVMHARLSMCFDSLDI